MCLPACAGTPADQGAPVLVDMGHGGMEDVLRVLSERGAPCQDPRELAPADRPPRVEQAMTCRIGPDREEVMLVHFFTPEGARQHYERSRAAGLHGVYTDTWAATSESQDAAQLVEATVTERR